MFHIQITLIEIHKQKPNEFKRVSVCACVFFYLTFLLFFLFKFVIKIEDCTLQIYRQNGSDAEYGAYLDLDQSLDEQSDDFDAIKDNKRTTILLRTQLSVRVHTCVEKILNSKDTELRRSLFLLKQLFQNDKDLVHEFVNKDGLECLVKVASDTKEHNYINYILRALGQLMLFVDGMNGVIRSNETVQWLYSVLASGVSSYFVTDATFLYM